MSTERQGVALVVPFLDHLGGTESLVWSLAQRFAVEGLPPLVLTSTHLREPPPAPRAAPGVRVIRIPALQRAPLLDLTWVLPGAAALAARAASYRVILGYHLPTGGVLAGLAGRLGGRPFAVITQGAGPLGDVEAWRRLPLRGLRRWALRGARFVAAVSSEAERELREAALDLAPLARLPSGCDTRAFRPPSPEERERARRELGLAADDFAVAYTGRLHPFKRLDTLLEAAAARGAGAAPRLLLTGEGSEREALERLAAARGIASRCAFLGRLPDQRIVLRAADLFVLPSASEGISVALLEAMASGLPVLVSDIPGNREVVGDGVQGLVRPLGDIAGWAEALEGLGRDPALRARLARAGRATVLERFDRHRLESRLVDWVAGRAALP